MKHIALLFLLGPTFAAAQTSDPLASMSRALELATVLGSEKLCGLTLDAAGIEAQIAARAEAKAAKNWAEADRIRKELLDQGIVLKDSAAGTTWEAAAKG